MLNRILIDPQAFVRDKDTLQGSIFLQDLDERVREHADLAERDSTLSYRLAGGYDGLQRPYLDLSVSGSLKLVCQRCLQPFAHALEEHSRIVLFDDETALDHAMIADEDLEGMTVEAETDVLALIEDQILMALPFAPRHDKCAAEDAPVSHQNKPNPFAALAGLKKTD